MFSKRVYYTFIHIIDTRKNQAPGPYNLDDLTIDLSLTSTVHYIFLAKRLSFMNPLSDQL